MPLRHSFTIGDVSLTLNNTYGNKLINFANYEIDNIENTQKDYDSGDLYFNRINSMILKNQNNDRSVARSITSISAVYPQRVYPASYNSYLNRTYTRENYSISNIWDKKRSNRAQLVPFTIDRDWETE